MKPVSNRASALNTRKLESGKTGWHIREREDDAIYLG